MIMVQAMEDGKVVWLETSAKELRPGFVEVPEVPEMPEVPSGKMPVMRLDREAARLYWDFVDAPPEPEPAPEPEPQAPTHAEIESARAAAYRERVDPITCEIARLRDMGGTAEEIAEAEARREAAVAAVKAQWPYPEATAPTENP